MKSSIAHRIVLSLLIALTVGACVDTGAVADDAEEDATPTDAPAATDAQTLDAPAPPGVKHKIVLFVREYDVAGDEVGCSGDLRLLIEGTEQEPYSCAPLDPNPEHRFGTTVFVYTRPASYARLDATIVAAGGEAVSPPEFVIPMIQFLYPQGAPPELWHFTSVQRR